MRKLKLSKEDIDKRMRFLMFDPVIDCELDTTNVETPKLELSVGYSNHGDGGSFLRLASVGIYMRQYMIDVYKNIEEFICTQEEKKCIKDITDNLIKLNELMLKITIVTPDRYPHFQADKAVLADVDKSQKIRIADSESQGAEKIKASDIGVPDVIVSYLVDLADAVDTMVEYNNIIVKNLEDDKYAADCMANGVIGPKNMNLLSSYVNNIRNAYNRYSELVDNIIFGDDAK